MSKRRDLQEAGVGVKGVAGEVHPTNRLSLSLDGVLHQDVRSFPDHNCAWLYRVVGVCHSVLGVPQVEVGLPEILQKISINDLLLVLWRDVDTIVKPFELHNKVYVKGVGLVVNAVDVHEKQGGVHLDRIIGWQVKLLVGFWDAHRAGTDLLRNPLSSWRSDWEEN